jgi:DNA-binding phage protein
MTLDQIRQAMRDRNLQAVANATGLNAHTLYRLMQGKAKPHNATLRVLETYLKG